MTLVCTPTAHNNSDIASVGLWQFDGNLNDSSGGSNNLSMSTGTVRYTDLFPGIDATNGGGLRGLLLDGSTVVGLSSSVGTFQITGNLTIEFIVTLGMPPGSTSYLFSHGASGESAGANYLYSLRVLSTNQLSYFAEHSSGTDIQFDSAACLCTGEPTHVAMVRSSNQVSLYMNGLLVGAASSGLSAPTSGTSGKLKIGGDAVDGQRAVAAISSFKIINSALSSGQVLDEYADTLSTCFPRV